MFKLFENFSKKPLQLHQIIKSCDMTAIEWNTECHTVKYIVVHEDYIVCYTGYNFYNELHYTVLQSKLLYGIESNYKVL